MKHNTKYAATVVSFRAMQELTFVQACSILMAVEREQRDKITEESEPEEKKEEVNVNLNKRSTTATTSKLPRTSDHLPSM